MNVYVKMNISMCVYVYIYMSMYILLYEHAENYETKHIRLTWVCGKGGNVIGWKIEIGEKGRK